MADDLCLNGAFALLVETSVAFRNGQSITVASKVAITLHRHDWQKNNTGLATLPAQRATRSPSPGQRPGGDEFSVQIEAQRAGDSIRPEESKPVWFERWSRKNRTAGPLDLYSAAAVLRSQAVGLGWVNEWSCGPKTVATQNWLIDFCRTNFCRTNTPAIRLGRENQMPATFGLTLQSQRYQKPDSYLRGDPKDFDAVKSLTALGEGSSERC